MIFKEQHFPHFTPVLHRYRGVDPLYFGPKWDDCWWVERFWAVIGNDVYREPRPTTIKQVMRRVPEASLKITEKTLTRMMHQMPAKLNEVYRLKGDRLPARFDPKKSPFACKCEICKV